MAPPSLPPYLPPAPPAPPPWPSTEPSPRLTNADIGLIRANLRVNVLDKSAQSSPRPWLSAEQNQEVAREVGAFWRRIDRHYAQMARLGLEDRPLQTDFSHAASEHFLQEIKQSKVNVFLGFSVQKADKHSVQATPVFDALPYSEKTPASSGHDVNRCISRDLERNLGLNIGLTGLAKMSEARKLAVAKKMNDQVQDSARTNEKAQSDGPPDFNRFVAGGVFGKSVSQKDVDLSRLNLSSRFGFDGVTIASSACTTLRQQAAWMASAEKSLVQACKRLGIEESHFGMDRRCAFQIDPPDVALSKGANGTFEWVYQDNARICLSASCQDPAGTLVHEYIHHLDNVLALKAREADPSLFTLEKPPEFFSEMSPAQQAALPLAQEGFAQVCRLTGRLKSSLLDSMKSLFSYEPTKVCNSVSPEMVQSELIDKALERFSVAHLGAEGYLQIDTQQHAQYRESLMKNGPRAILSIAKGWANKPMDEILNCMQSAGGDGSDKAKHYMEIARGIHGDNEMVRRKEAVQAIEPLLVELSARLHPMSIACQAPGELTPGSMMQNAVRKDREGMNWGKRSGYYSYAPEVFARLIDRPHGLDRVISVTQSPWETSAMNRRELAELSAGLVKMLDSAGVIRKGPPKLGSFSESKQIAVVGMALAITTGTDKLASRCLGMLSVKAPALRQAPGPGA